MGKDSRGKPEIQYLVRWKSYGPERDEWRRDEKLRDAKELLDEYKQQEGTRAQRDHRSRHSDGC